MLKRWRSFFSLCLRDFKSGLGDRSIVPVGVVLRFNFSGAVATAPIELSA